MNKALKRLNKKLAEARRVERSILSNSTDPNRHTAIMSARDTARRRNGLASQQYITPVCR